MTDALLNLFPYVAPPPLRSGCPGIHTLTPALWIQGRAGVPPRHLQGKDDPAARRMYVTNHRSIRPCVVADRRGAVLQTTRSSRRTAPRISCICWIHLLRPEAQRAPRCRCFWTGVCLVCPGLRTVCGAPTDSFPVNKIKLLCVLASQTGLNRVRSEYPDLEVRHCLSATRLVISCFEDLGVWCGSRANRKRSHCAWPGRHCMYFRADLLGIVTHEHTGRPIVQHSSGVISLSINGHNDAASTLYSTWLNYIHRAMNCTTANNQ